MSVGVAGCGQRRVRALLVGLVAGVVLLAAAGTAAAHTALASSTPVDGASVERAPSRVTLTFSEPVQESFSTVTVTGPEGRRWERGPVQERGDTVSAALEPLGPAGRYVVAYRVLSADGHPVSGTIDFTLTAVGPAAAANPPSPAPVARDAPAPGRTESEMPVWPWLAGAVVLAGGGAVAARRLGRR